MSKEEELKKLREDVLNCKKCFFHLSRKNVVFGMGNPDAKIMFVGEAPGYYEDIEGIPFVGQAGKLLDKLLREINLSRDEIYIANVMKCRPPKNRDPLPQEIEACKPYLLKQIEIIQPSLICTLGRFAFHTLYGQKLSISKFHGKLHNAADFFIYPLFHPAAALHQNAILPYLREDFLKIPEVIKNLRYNNKKNNNKKPVQITFFDL